MTTETTPQTLYQTLAVLQPNGMLLRDALAHFGLPAIYNEHEQDRLKLGLTSTNLGTGERSETRVYAKSPDRGYWPWREAAESHLNVNRMQPLGYPAFAIIGLPLYRELTLVLGTVTDESLIYFALMQGVLNDEQQVYYDHADALAALSRSSIRADEQHRREVEQLKQAVAELVG